jgi:predicted TIM-barrel fold metal-dependent hydrolase
MSGKTHQLDWLISVDDHVLEPRDVWTSRLPSKYLDVGPRIVVDGGVERWAYEDVRRPTTALSAAIGHDKTTWGMQSMNYDEMRPGCYDPVARVADMDAAGVLASLCFPSFPRFCGQAFWEAKDKELALLCVRAYNDWMVEEWCASAPGRFIPLIIIPLWDPVAAAAEIRRNAERGGHAVCFSEDPEPLGLPTIWDPDRYWNPVWDACQETETVVCMHIGSSSRIPKVSEEFPYSFNQAWAAGVVSSGTMLSWLIGPPLREFPGLKIALSEGGIGWMPYFLERGAQIVDRRSAMLSRGEEPDPTRLSVFVHDQSKALDLSGFDIHEMFRQHVYGCFIDDLHGVANLHEIGIDNVMIETDYPHSDSTWPDCISYAHQQLDTNGALTDEDKYKVLRGNAEKIYHFTPAAPPSMDPTSSEAGTQH